MALVYEKVVVTAKGGEVWRDIDGYDGVYQVSNLGNIKSISRSSFDKRGAIRPIKERILKPIFSGFKRQYLVVTLYKDKIGDIYLIHRLVALHFIPNPENKPEVNHIGKDDNGVINKLDNREFSLTWSTSKENIQHAWDNGLMENVRKIASMKRTPPKQKKYRRIILNLETGIFYGNRRDAASASIFTLCSLGKQLAGINKNKSSFIYV